MITCASHHQAVTITSDFLICHQDGGYCSDERFTTESLTRAQAMALLILSRGMEDAS